MAQTLPPLCSKCRKNLFNTKYKKFLCPSDMDEDYADLNLDHTQVPKHQNLNGKKSEILDQGYKQLGLKFDGQEEGKVKVESKGKLGRGCIRGMGENTFY
jgi:hypothetical protein